MRFPKIREYDHPRYAYSGFLWPRINRRQGKKLEVAALVESRTFACIDEEAVPRDSIRAKTVSCITVCFSFRASCL
jgi:hypothetical protein